MDRALSIAAVLAPVLAPIWLCASALAQDGAPDPPAPGPVIRPTVTDRLPADDRALLVALESLAWVPDGPASDRQVYVISAPWCGYCQRLYRKSKDLEGIQFRWIKTGARSAKHERQIAAASLSRDPATLEAIYLGGRLPKISDPAAADRIVSIHERALSVLSDEIKRRSGGRWGFPTLIYTTQDGLVVTGASPDPESQVADVVPRPEARDLVPVAHRLAKAEFETEGLDGVVVGTGVGADVVRLLPADGAPVITRLKRGRGFEAISQVSVDGASWYAVRVFEDGTPGYVRTSDAVYRAR